MSNPSSFPASTSHQSQISQQIQDNNDESRNIRRENEDTGQASPNTENSNVYWPEKKLQRYPLIVVAMTLLSDETCWQRTLNDLKATTLPCFFGAMATGVCKNNGATPRTVGIPLTVGGMCDYHNEYLNEIEYCNQYVFGNKTMLFPFSCHAIAKNGTVWKSFPILCAQPLDSSPSDYILQFRSRVPHEEIDAESHICALATSGQRENVTKVESQISASMAAFVTDWLPKIRGYLSCWRDIVVNMYFTDRYLCRKKVAENKWIRDILEGQLPNGRPESCESRKVRVVQVRLENFPVFDMLTIVKYQLASITTDEKTAWFDGVVTDVAPNVQIIDGYLVHGLGTGLKWASPRKITHVASNEDDIETLAIQSKSVVVTPEPLYLDAQGPMHHPMPIGVFGSDPFCTTIDNPEEAFNDNLQERSSYS